MTKIFLAAGAMLGAAMVIGTPASAAPFTFCSTGAGAINLVTQGCVSRDGDGFYVEAGGGDSELKVEQAIVQATGNKVDLTLYGKSDDNPLKFVFDPLDPEDEDALTGSWDVVDNSVLIKYITIKASKNYAVYELPGLGLNFGTFTTEGLLTANGRGQAGFSHMSFWTVETDTVIPEPETWALMVGGFGLLGGALRRRRRLAEPKLA